MKILTATRKINIGVGVTLGAVGLLALLVTFVMMLKTVKAETIKLPPPAPDVAACKSIASRHGLVEQPAPKLPSGQTAPWSPDGIHFVQSKLDDAKEQVLNATAFHARCGMELNYFCVGAACTTQGNHYMRLVLLPKVNYTDNNTPTPAPKK